MPSDELEAGTRESADGFLILRLAKRAVNRIAVNQEVTSSSDDVRADAGVRMDALAPKSQDGAASAATARAIPDDAMIIVPVRNVVLFPGMVVPLVVDRERSRAAVQEAVRQQRPVGILLQSKPRGRAARARRPALGRHDRQRAALRHRARRRAPRDLPGCAALSRAAVPRRLSDDGRARPAHRGIRRRPSPEIEGRAHSLKERALEILRLLPQVPEEMVVALQGVDGPARLADFIAGVIDVSVEEKQALLEMFDLKKRLDKLLELLTHRIEVLKVSREIDDAHA